MEKENKCACGKKAQVQIGEVGQCLTCALKNDSRDVKQKLAGLHAAIRIKIAKVK